MSSLVSLINPLQPGPSKETKASERVVGIPEMAIPMEISLKVCR